MRLIHERLPAVAAHEGFIRQVALLMSFPIRRGTERLGTHPAGVGFDSRVDAELVVQQTALLSELTAAGTADIRLLPRVYLHVSLHFALISEPLTTHIALVRLLPRVALDVNPQLVPRCKSLVAEHALMRTVVVMRFFVFIACFSSLESSGTLTTRKRFLSSVTSFVTHKF